MRKFLKLFPICLYIHDGAAAAGAAAGAAAPGESGAAADGDNGGTKLPDITIRGKKITGENDGPKVLYGKQDDSTDAEGKKEATGTQTPEERKAAFKELANGEYKDEFTSYFQETFDKRFKDTKAIKEQLDAYKPIADLLSDKYGITDGDPKKIAEAVQGDNQLWEDMAEDAGMTVQQYKEYASDDSG